MLSKGSDFADHFTESATEKKAQMLSVNTGTHTHTHIHTTTGGAANDIPRRQATAAQGALYTCTCVRLCVCGFTKQLNALLWHTMISSPGSGPGDGSCAVHNNSAISTKRKLQLIMARV